MRLYGAPTRPLPSSTELHGEYGADDEDGAQELPGAQDLAQERHRQQLQQDRDRMGYHPERLEVPVMRPNCTTSVYGSSLSAGCR